MEKFYLKVVIVLIMFAISIGTVSNYSTAHEGEDHSPPSINQIVPLGESFFVSKESQFINEILTEPAANRILNHTITSTGKIIPSAKGIAEVYSPYKGDIISDIPMIGNYVMRGSRLITLRQTLSIPDQVSITNEKLKAEVDYERALQEYERLSQLEGVVAQKDIERSRINLEAAKRSVDYYNGILQKNNSSATSFNISSPISGVIIESNVTRGEQIDNSKKLFTIVNMNELWIEAKIYESDLSKLYKISDANITVQSLPGEIFKGRLVNVSDVIDETTGTVNVIFSIVNPRGMLKLGMFTSLNIITDESSEALSVPVNSVVDVNGKKVVFVHTSPQGFAGKEVVTGRSDGLYIEIIHGLNEKERVVISGNHQLRSKVF